MDGYYIYFYYHNKNIIYIGQTIHLNLRIYQHSNDYIFKKYCKDNNISYSDFNIRYFECGCKTEMDGIEKILINQYKPELNIKDKNVGIKSVIQLDISKFKWFDYDTNKYAQNVGEINNDSVIETISEEKQNTPDNVESNNYRYNRAIPLSEISKLDIGRYDLLHDYGVWKDTEGYHYIENLSIDRLQHLINMYEMLHPNNRPFIEIFYREKCEKERLEKCI